MRALVERQQLAELDALREQLPLDDPDRHALDVQADAAFAQLACECDDPCACNPKDGNA
jgi:hypothetical protein